MIAGRGIAREIESHFYAYAEERAGIRLLEAEIAEACTPKTNETGVWGTDTSDPTAQKAVQIEEELWEAKAWVKVVENTVRHFSGTPRAEFLAMVYSERQSVAHVCAHLFFDRSTYFRWREKIIDFALIKAVEEGLVHV